MRTNEIVHINGRYKKIDCDLIDQCHVCIRLKTGKDIRRVEVVYNDPYIRYEGSNGLVWPNYVVDMERTGETFDSYYFSVVLPCESHRLKYYLKYMMTMNVCSLVKVDSQRIIGMMIFLCSSFRILRSLIFLRSLSGLEM